MRIFKLGRIKSPVSKCDLFTDLENVIFEKKELLRIALGLAVICFILGVLCGKII